MGLSLAALGAFGNGVFQGMDQGRQRQEAKELDAQRRQERKRNEDLRVADEEIAREAYRAIHPQAPEGLGSPSLAPISAPAGQPAAAGGAAAAPAGAAVPTLSGATPTQPQAQQQPRSYTDGDMFRYWDAAADGYARRGLLNSEGFKNAFSQRATLQGRMLKAELQPAIAKLAAGDASGLGAIYNRIGDGRQFVGAEAAKGPNGEAGFNVQLRKNAASKPVSTWMPAEGLIKQATLLADPSMLPKVMELELKGYADRAKAAAEESEKRRTNADKEAGERETVKLKHGLTLKEIGARTAGDIKVKQTASPSDTNFTLGEGQTRFGLQGGKAVEIAKGQPKSGGSGKSLDDDNLHNLVINGGFGELDQVTGRYRGNNNTLAIAGRARDWKKQYPELSDLDAIKRAAEELK